jgi:predicted Zn finger-like uncharacterized protein
MATLAPFRVRCPSCDTEFPVDPRKVPEHGVHAICSACRRVFHVSHPEDLEWPDEAAPGDADASEATFEVERPESAPEADEPEAEFEVERPESASEADEPEATFEPDEPDVALEVDEAAPEPDAGRPEQPPTHAEAPATASEPVGVEGKTLSEGLARFGRRDPHERARHLARVLVSDMITYHPARYESASEGGTLKEDFAEEVDKSWDEYREQVGEEIADGTDYFVRALNEILGGGKELYGGQGRPS